MVCGIKPNTPGFKSVRIEPNLKNINQVDAKFPHQLGIIHVNIQKDKNNHISGKITLPIQLEGVFVCNGAQMCLQGGVNIVE